MKKMFESQGENTNLEALEDEIYVLRNGEFVKLEVEDDAEND